MVFVLAGLFHFDASFRPVPLETRFVGVSVDNFAARNSLMTEICYNKVIGLLFVIWLPTDLCNNSLIRAAIRQAIYDFLNPVLTENSMLLLPSCNPKIFS
jgi:hypothetical protein